MPLIKCTLLAMAISMCIDCSSSQACRTFNNTDMLLIDKRGRTFTQEVSGCITRQEFGDTTVIRAYVSNQTIPKLGRDSVKHMLHLSKVSFKNCYLEEIKPMAFRNVPNLLTIEIAFNELKHIPKGVFNFDLTPGLKTLKMDHNKITSIEDQAFHNISNLKSIQLNNNKLDSFRPEWFKDTPSLEIMNITFNSLNEIPAKAFINFNKLQQIHLDYNDIVTIREDAFKGIRNLTHLGLSHNRLILLNDASFPNTLRIGYLKINANYMTFLSDGIFKKLTAVKINLDFNPWTCQCLERINYWLYIKNGVIENLEECRENYLNDVALPVCVVPKNTISCMDQFDHEAMLRYINAIKIINMSTPIPTNCVNFQVSQIGT